jgi:DNA-binding transcriptional MerR regulator
MTFSIGQVAEKTGLSSYTLRYYETMGLLPGVERAENGHRRYSQGDVEWIQFLLCLRATNMPIADMQTFTEMTRQGDHTIPARRALLDQHRERVLAQIAELQRVLEHVEGKIRYYAEVEKTLQVAEASD